MAAREPVRLTNYFLFWIELPQKQNREGAYERFQESLRGFFLSSGYDNCGFGAMGGNLRCYGNVACRQREVAEEDRLSLAAWIGKQEVSGTIRIGPLRSMPIRLDFDFGSEWIDFNMPSATQS